MTDKQTEPIKIDEWSVYYETHQGINVRIITKEKQADGTFELTTTIPWSKVRKSLAAKDKRFKDKYK